MNENSHTQLFCLFIYAKQRTVIFYGAPSCSLSNIFALFKHFRMNPVHLNVRFIMIAQFLSRKYLCIIIFAVPDQGI